MDPAHDISQIRSQLRTIKPKPPKLNLDWLWAGLRWACCPGCSSRAELGAHGLPSEISTMYSAYWSVLVELAPQHFAFNQLTGTRQRVGQLLVCTWASYCHAVFQMLLQISSCATVQSSLDWCCEPEELREEDFAFAGSLPVLLFVLSSDDGEKCRSCRMSKCSPK